MECQQCGSCCSKYAESIFATASDLKRWIREDRYDILKHFEYMGKICTRADNLNEYDEIESSADLINPKTKDFYYKSCPFKKKVRGTDLYKCSIHNTKPELCKDYTPWIDGWRKDLSPQDFPYCKACQSVS